MNYIGNQLGKLGDLQGIVNQYSSILVTVGMVFALLNCFFGYKLRKVWITLVGLLVGAGAGGAAGYYFLHDVKLAAAIGAGAAILLAVFAFHIYRLGLFVLCGGLTFWILNQLLSQNSSMARGVCIAAGVGVGILALQYERIVVILTTGLCGGLGAARLLLTLMGRQSTVLMVVLGIVLAALGILFQYRLGTQEGDREFRDDSRSLFQRDKKKRGKRRKNRKSLRDYLPSRRKKRKVTRSRRGGAVEETEYSDGSQNSGRDSRSGQQKKGRDAENVGKKVQEPVREMEQRKEESLYDNPLDMDEIAKLISEDVKKIYDEQDE